MREIPPEILAIALPTGYTWGIYMEDPVVYGPYGSADCWVNMEGIRDKNNEKYMSLYFVDTRKYIKYKDYQPPLTVVDLCKILAAHVWMDV